MISVHFPLDDQTGYAVGEDGTILKTTNGGTNWSGQSSATSNILRSVYFPGNTLTGYAVGDGGNILKTTYGGNWVEQNPEGEGQRVEVRLLAKPNPFSEQTLICYQLTLQGPVRLVVYNISGQVVRVLVKEAKKAGSYQAVWDGKNGFGQKVGSGVYFVRLDAGNYSETRKVVLIR